VGEDAGDCSGDCRLPYVKNWGQTTFFRLKVSLKLGLEKTSAWFSEESNSFDTP
jgi:hypothetical protein